MANGFQGPPSVDFYSMLSGLGDTIQQNQKLRAAQNIQTARQGAFSKFSALDPASPDYGRQAASIATDLGAAGDTEGALKFLSLSQQGADRAHTLAREGVTDALANRADARAERTANRADEDKYVIKEQEDPNGGPSTFVRIKTTGAEGPISVGAAPGAAPYQPANPYAAGGKTTAEQDKSGGFADRMMKSEAILSGQAPTKGQEGPVSPGVQNEGTGYGLAALSGKYVPNVVGNTMMTPAQQQYQQARLDFVNAQLRKESGAAISQSEFDNAYKQYFPQPGDGPDVIRQKQVERRTATEAMARDAGRGYRPKFTFNDQGVLEPRAMPAPAAQPPQRPAQVMGQVNPKAIAALKANPKLAAQFDAKYGPGASASILGDDSEEQ